MTAAALSLGRRWDASLSLRFEAHGGVTRLVDKCHAGPLRIQKTFLQSDGSVHAYVLHPPAGVVGGDRIDVAVSCVDAARALLTTPGSAKSYRDNGFESISSTQLVVGAKARLDWLPWENILFNGARAVNRLAIDAAGESQFVVFDAWCFGRPASKERFDQGCFTSNGMVNIEGQTVLLDRAIVRGGAPELDSDVGLGGHPFVGTVWCYPASDDWLDALRHSGIRCSDARWGVSRVDGLGIARILSHSAESLHAIGQAIWRHHFSFFQGHEPAFPRIWNT